MYKLKSLVVYKKKPAIIKELGEKLLIEVQGAAPVRVREKDIEFIHPGPLENFNTLDGSFSDNFAEEAWELYSEETQPPELKDIAELAGGYTAKNAWLAWLLVEEGVYFEGSAGGGALRVKPRTDVEAALRKRNAKQAEGEQRGAFLDRLRSKTLVMPADSRFLQDVEALAFGKSEKSRTMKDIGLSETPEAAHKLLLEQGVWDNFVNPHPSRYGVNPLALKASCQPPDNTETRQDLTALAAYAIDDEFSTDPDDAVSLEITPEAYFLYVHVADPSASVLPGSDADREARERGATLYAPESISRMLSEEALNYFALGLAELSPALSFKIKLTLSGGTDIDKIEVVELCRSMIRVTRLTYREAAEKPELAPFFLLTEASLHRRVNAGAAQIDLPEVEISVEQGEICITPLKNYPSRSLVRECMLIAGEAVAAWALEKRLPFPYISQEAESVPGKLLDGYAGAFQLRRCMRPRLLSTKPGLHQGLGLDIYTQITSPLRRYTDLLAHQQISAFLRGTPPLDEDSLLARLAASERAAIAVSKAERASRAHWTAVYLSGRIGQTWEGVILELRGPHAIVLLPALGLEIQSALPRGRNFAPNDICTIKLSSVRIAEAETRWVISAENE